MVVMNAITSLFAAMPGAPVETSHFVSTFISWIQGLVGNYGWTVVLFTVALKLIMSPLDFWQRHSMYKNARIQKRTAPQVAKLQKQYANNRQMFQQKQLELYRKEGYSVFGGCLPMIITLVLFFVIFAGFNETTTFNASQEYYQIATIWEETYNEVYDDKADEVATELQNAYDTAYNAVIAQDPTDTVEAESAGIAAKRAYMSRFEAEFRAAADQAVLDGYKPTSWLWVTNVFMSDNWSAKIPDYDTFSGAGLGKLGITADKMVTNAEDYNKHTAALRKEYGGWNGYLILPVLTIVSTFLGQFLSKKMTPNQPGNEQNAQQAKMMQWMMPVMMGFFSLFYSGIFTIYLLISQVISLLTQVGFNVYSKIVDKKEEDLRLRTTFKH